MGQRRAAVLHQAEYGASEYRTTEFRRGGPHKRAPKKRTHRGERIEVPTARSASNLYAVEWTPEEIRGYVNDTHYFTFENEALADPARDERHWPFDHPFHLILNVAVGGAWGGQQGIDPHV